MGMQRSYPVTTNQKLRQLKDEHGLTINQIREITSASRSIVYAWLADDRNMPAAKLELLEIKLAAQGARGK